MSTKAKVAIAVSGKGRSLENLLRQPSEPFTVAAVICSNPKAGAVEIAKREGLPLYAFDAKAVDAAGLESWLLEHGIDWVALAGFLKIFPHLRNYEGRVVNIHPALLPKFGGHGMYGHKVHEAVLAARETHSGATIHFVNERYDEGAIIAQGTVDIHGLGDAQAIADRVFDLECRLYPRTLGKLIAGELPLPGGRIWSYTE